MHKSAIRRENGSYGCDTADGGLLFPLVVSLGHWGKSKIKIEFKTINQTLRLQIRPIVCMDFSVAEWEVYKQIVDLKLLSASNSDDWVTHSLRVTDWSDLTESWAWCRPTWRTMESWARRWFAFTRENLDPLYQEFSPPCCCWIQNMGTSKLWVNSSC